jgi:uncharacterized membrane protein
VTVLDLPRSTGRRLGLLGLSAFFILAGVNHFRRPRLYERIMPPYLPAHRLLVQLSGGLEILGGAAALAPATREAAGWGLVALLGAVYPANIHMALHPERFPAIPRWAIYARLPAQLPLAGWCVWATRD